MGMKLFLISFYDIFYVHRPCSDITFFIPDLVNLCLLSLFLYILLKVNDFYLSFKKKTIVIDSFL